MARTFTVIPWLLSLAAGTCGNLVHVSTRVAPPARPALLQGEIALQALRGQVRNVVSNAIPPAHQGPGLRGYRSAELQTAPAPGSIGWWGAEAMLSRSHAPRRSREPVPHAASRGWTPDLVQPLQKSAGAVLIAVCAAAVLGGCWTFGAAARRDSGKLSHAPLEMAAFMAASDRLAVAGLAGEEIIEPTQTCQDAVSFRAAAAELAGEDAAAEATAMSQGTGAYESLGQNLECNDENAADTCLRLALSGLVIMPNLVLQEPLAAAADVGSALVESQQAQMAADAVSQQSQLAAEERSPQQALLRWLTEVSSGNMNPEANAELLAQVEKQPEATNDLLVAGGGLLVIFGFIVPFLKLVVAGGTGIYVVREAQASAGRQGQDTQKVVERVLKKLSGEPPDLLDERRLRAHRLNDEFVSLRASLLEQTQGFATAASFRDSARKTRFIGFWQRTLDGLEITEEERQKVDEAVKAYTEAELKRRRDYDKLMELRLANGITKGFSLAGLISNYRLGAIAGYEQQLEDELIKVIVNTVPEKALNTVRDALTDNKLRWIADAEHAARENQVAAVSSHVYVLSFDGDVTAAGVSALAEEVSAVLGTLQSTAASRHGMSSSSSDSGASGTAGKAQVAPEVVLRLKSPGGTVTGYGLAAAQLMRFREHGVKLVVCVDELAASGGYLMACCADTILCSPFAAIGSIGVISGVPNVSERLGKEGIQVIQTTAGKWKRTVDPFQAPTDEALAKAKDDVMMIYRQFAGFVKTNRPQVDIEKVATGEVWFGSDALKRGLVDELTTSTAYLQRCIARGCEVVALTYNEKPQGVSSLVGASMDDIGSLGKAANLMESAGLLQKLASTATGSPSAWPAGVPQPRFEAQDINPDPMSGLYPK